MLSLRVRHWLNASSLPFYSKLTGKQDWLTFWRYSTFICKKFKRLQTHSKSCFKIACVCVFFLTLKCSTQNRFLLKLNPVAYPNVGSLDFLKVTREIVGVPNQKEKRITAWSYLTTSVFTKSCSSFFSILYDSCLCSLWMEGGAVSYSFILPPRALFH